MAPSPIPLCLDPARPLRRVLPALLHVRWAGTAVTTLAGVWRRQIEWWSAQADTAFELESSVWAAWQPAGCATPWPSHIHCCAMAAIRAPPLSRVPRGPAGFGGACTLLSCHSKLGYSECGQRDLLGSWRIEHVRCHTLSHRMIPQRNPANTVAAAAVVASAVWCRAP